VWAGVAAEATASHDDADSASNANDATNKIAPVMTASHLSFCATGQSMRRD